MSRLVHRTIPALVLAWLAAVCVVVWLVVTGRNAAVERGQQATSAFASVVEQQVARTIQATYLTLGVVADARQVNPSPPKDDPAFQKMMARRLADLPFVRATFVIDASGWIVHDTDYPSTPQISLADRPYFVAYKNGRLSAETVWPPMLSRSGTGWFVPVTHPVAQDGSFQGIVVAALQVRHFEDQFRQIGLPEDFVVSLFHRDGTLIASYPPTAGEIGRNYPELVKQLTGRKPVSFITDAGLVEGTRLVSYRALDVAPVVVRVSRARDGVLAEWRRTALVSAVAMAVLTVALGWYMLHVRRESIRLVDEREKRAQTEKLEALGQLAGGMAHDFANVLNIVAMNTSVMRAKLSDPALMRNSLETIERAVQSGKQVSDRLLRIARRSPPRLTPVRLDQWLELARPLCTQALGSGVSLTIDCDKELPFVLCDATELDVVLVNLLVNARAAMDGSGRVTIRAYACRGDHRAPVRVTATTARFVCLTLEDTGCGMSNEVKRRAFEPLYTTKGEEGTGLGLWQVQTFMRAVGGDVTIDSAVGMGTAVHLVFPAAATKDISGAVDLNGAKVEARSDRPGGPSNSSVELPVVQTGFKDTPPESGVHSEREAFVEGLRVLVVDDNVDAAASLSAVLAALGHTVQTAHDAASAIAMSKTFRPQIALLDVGLPDMDGYELARRLRESSKANTEVMHLVAVTGYALESDGRHSMDAGFDEHLVKPVDLAKLERLLAEVQAERRIAHSDAAD